VQAHLADGPVHVLIPVHERGWPSHVGTQGHPTTITGWEAQPVLHGPVLQHDDVLAAVGGRQVRPTAEVVVARDHARWLVHEDRTVTHGDGPVATADHEPALVLPGDVASHG